MPKPRLTAVLYAIMQVRAMGAEKERATAESRVREAMAVERTRLMAAADEGRREAAVQKALAEGWSRDLKVRALTGLCTNQHEPYL